ncbi:hypothetical protein ACL6C3_20390 [Capilliphycus salinus ALCB114379]|uniref:hypothetical protein n=1 Tax=Capilliphycus salinus TaxID=2768948 RepID=UPI0039A5C0CF
MISDQEFLYGAALLKLINFGNKVTLVHYSYIHSSLYLIETDNTKSAVLFKLSKKPKSAWSFTFSEQEDIALKTVRDQHLNVLVFLALVCHKDGICCMALDRVLDILENRENISGQYISVSRRPRGSYHISGAG